MNSKTPSGERLKQAVSAGIWVGGGISLIGYGFSIHAPLAIAIGSFLLLVPSIALAVLIAYDRTEGESPSDHMIQDRPDREGDKKG
jgi:hypothetical protein